MKYHRLHITTDGTFEMYDSISKLLNLNPMPAEDERFGSSFSIWTYGFDIDGEQEYFDFINVFLDILEPSFSALEQFGIYKDDIIFWVNYEYSDQCAMSFHPKEMKRLGELGIGLNIDCFKIKN